MTTHSPKRVSHTTTNNIINLMKNLSELVIIMGRYLGIYAKDSLDELLLTTHHNSSYGGRSREVERNAVNHYIDDLRSCDELNDYNEIEWRDDFPYETIKEDINKTMEIENEVERSEDSMRKPNGDNFPYIRGHSNPY